MNIRKTIVLAGALLILGAGSIFAVENSQSQDEIGGLDRIALRFQMWSLFIDENGDGLCDLGRDHDNDGIPNSQDPDWTRPLDGTGYKNKNEVDPNANRFSYMNGHQNGNSWTWQSFGTGDGKFGTGECDETGPKGKTNKGGRG